MLTRTPHHLDLDAARHRADQAAVTAATRADRDFLRFAGLAFVRAAEVNGADYEAERVNARLRAAGRSDFVRTATARLRAPIDARVVDAVASALTGARRG